MASSSYTPNLHLSNWSASDRPKRADFVSDNSIIDTALGGHLADSAVHLTAAEKERIAEPFVLRVYSGNGEATRTIDLGFQAKLVIVYRRGVSPVSVSSGETHVNCAVASFGYGGTAGIALNTSGVLVSQSASASDGQMVDLNKSGTQYTIVAFR